MRRRPIAGGPLAIGLAMTLVLALACDMPSLDSATPDARDDLGAWIDGNEDDTLPGSRQAVNGGDDPLSHFQAGPSAEIQVQEDVTVHVGQELLLTFYADVWEVDPAETYFVVEGAPDGAHVDEDAGTFRWVPTVEDIGVHTIGLDLWYETDDRVLDAARILIEVIPADSLIEVGI